MSATRPVIFAALKTLLKTEVTAVSNRVYLPWDDQPETSAAPFLQIEVISSTVSEAGIAFWDHTVTIAVGCVKTGKFDYQSTWDILSAASSTLAAHYTLGGVAINTIVSDPADEIIVEGTKILWPHFRAAITYRTAIGTI